LSNKHEAANKGKKRKRKRLQQVDSTSENDQHPSTPSTSSPNKEAISKENFVSIFASTLPEVNTLKKIKLSDADVEPIPVSASDDDEGFWF